MQVAACGLNETTLHRGSSCVHALLSSVPYVSTHRVSLKLGFGRHGGVPQSRDEQKLEQALFVFVIVQSPGRLLPVERAVMRPLVILAQRFACAPAPRPRLSIVRPQAQQRQLQGRLARPGISRDVQTAAVGAASVTEAAQLQKDGWELVDVRTALEFQDGHPAGAVNIPLHLGNISEQRMDQDFVKKVASRFPDKDAKLLISCRSGARSAMSCGLLEQHGYKNLKNVTGGFNSWVQSRLPTQKV